MLLAAVIVILLAATGILGFLLELVVGVVASTLGLGVALIAGGIGLGIGLLGAALGIVVGLFGLVLGLLPILIPVAVIWFLVKSNSSTAQPKRKNDQINIV